MALFRPDASYYTEYTENPAIQYTLDKTWGRENKTLSFEFWQPASGTARDNYTTMIASGDLPDIIDAVVSRSSEVMVQNGYADITEYVEQYMPNYVELVHSNDIYYKNAVTLKDGKSITIACLLFMIRRKQSFRDIYVPQGLDCKIWDESGNW